jgi:hypothetical protein
MLTLVIFILNIGKELNSNECLDCQDKEQGNTTLGKSTPVVFPPVKEKKETEKNK